MSEQWTTEFSSGEPDSAPESQVDALDGAPATDGEDARWQSADATADAPT